MGVLMGLEKDTVSLSLAKSINQKIDEKIIGPEQMNKVKDCVFDKDGALKKRNGQEIQSDDSVNSFPNALTIGPSISRNKTFEHENQLGLINKGVLYSQYEGQDKWMAKGYMAPINVSTASLDGSVAFTDCGSAVGLTALMNNSTVFVREDISGNILSTTAAGTNEVFLRVVAFSDALWVLKYDAAQLKAQQVNTTDGTLGAEITITQGGNTLPNMTQQPYASSFCAVTYTTGGLLGSVAFIGYASQATGQFVIFPFKSDGTVPALSFQSVPFFSTSSTSGNQPPQISLLIDPSVDANRIFVALKNGPVSATPHQVALAVYTFTTSAYTTVLAPTVKMDPNTLFAPFCSSFANLKYFQNVAMFINPNDTTKLYLVADVFNYPSTVTIGNGGTVSSSDPYAFSSDTYDSAIYYVETDLSGTTLSGPSVLSYGMTLACNPINDSDRDTVYLPCVLTSPTQTQMIYLDVFRSRSTFSPYLAARFLYGKALRVVGLSQATTLASDANTYRMVNNGFIVDTDIGPNYSPQSQYIAKSTHIAGALLGVYDGQSIVEHGFVYGAESVSAWVGTEYIALTINQQGAVGVNEIFTVTFQQASAWTNSIRGNVTGSTAFRYVQFNDTTSAWYIWFRVDGIGGDPAPAGRTGIVVDFNSTDLPFEMAYKTAIAVRTANGNMNIQVTDGAAKFTVTPTGAVTDATLQGSLPVFLPGVATMDAGSYQYSVIWRWVDRNGQVYRSLPSVPVTVTAASGDRSGVTIKAPALTNKNITSVYADVYRTIANGTTFYYVTSTTWTTSSSRVYVRNAGLDRTNVPISQSDASIEDNQILYTDGGVLENFCIGAVSSLSTFKNRLMVVPIDDPTAIYYSKTLVNGEPINFSQFNQLRFDDDSLPVMGHAQMDDKLVVFKKRSTLITAGDGSNDLGQGDTFQLPVRIPGDIGCINPNSIVLCRYGLLFQSDSKGIWGFSRGLNLEYIGAGCDDFKDLKVAQACLLKKYDHIVFTMQDSTESPVFNELLNRWDVWTNQGGDSACVWQGNYARVNDQARVYVEGSLFYDVEDSGPVQINRLIETAWLKLKGLMGFQRVYGIQLLGDYKSPHTLKFDISYDYKTDVTTYQIDSAIFLSEPPYTVEVQPARQKCESIKLKIYETTTASGTREAAIWNAIDLYVGLKRGLNKLNPNKTI